MPALQVGRIYVIRFVFEIMLFYQYDIMFL